ncbi:MAG: DUF1232 domain-containing protein [Lachnospiraceae bacterium]|nr:DUF1232 domain-containing protein [Lachnospiraceae bacterium]
MKTEFTEEELGLELKGREAEAKELLEDEDKMERFLERLEKKLKKVPAVGDKLSDIPVLISLVRSYVKKEYTDIPIGSIIAILGSLIYFVSPIDLIPDTVPVVGYIDDIAVISFAMKMVQDDVDEYKEWQKKHGKRVFGD